MLPSHAFRPFELGLRALHTRCRVTSSPHFLNTAVSTWVQARLKSSLVTLWPPWQVSDLSPKEQKLYEEFGSEYVNHCSTKKEKERILKAIRDRKFSETYLKKRLGTDWYNISREANRRFRELERPIKENFRERRAQLLESSATPTHDDDEKLFELVEAEKAWEDARREKKFAIEQEVAEEFRKSSP